MKTYKIALVSLSTSMVGCTDPIVGNWDGKTLMQQGEQADLPFEYCYGSSDSDSEGGEDLEEENSEEDSCHSIDFYISIEDDLFGTIDMSILGVETRLNMLPLESSEDYKYSLAILGDSLELQCSLTSEVLVCGFEDQFSVEFEKVK